MAATTHTDRRTDHKYSQSAVRARYTAHNAVLDLVPAGSSVLDVGCSIGDLGAKLLAAGAGPIVGIEPEAAAAVRARSQGLSVVDGDLEGALAGRAVDEAGPYDRILLADVLEHTADPLTPLREVRRWLAPGGALVISVPNIAYGPARIRLLRGIWRYEETGIFDATHLRFFTLATARELIADAGYRVTAEIPVGPATWALGARGLPVTRLRPQLLAVQIVFAAVPLR